LTLRRNGHFAIRCLRVWHEAGADVQALLPTLSVYLGHVRPEDTYWYLTATPDLLRVARALRAGWHGRG